MNVVRGPLSRKIAAKTEIHGLLLRFVCCEKHRTNVGRDQVLGKLIYAQPVLALAEFLVARCSGEVAESLRFMQQAAAAAFFNEFYPFCNLCLMF